MSKLFGAGTIGGLTLSNRLVRSATFEGMADDTGACTPKLINLMDRLAKGGVGLIITGFAYVRKDGKAVPRQLGIYDDYLIPGLLELTETVHERGGKIVLQLAHAGAVTRAEITGSPPLVVSQGAHQNGSAQREMSIQDIQDIIQSFGKAAFRAREAGFDGVQIHAAHGYLLSQFLSPLFNHRHDEYGGGIENRARVLGDVVQEIRKTVGKDYPIMVKMNSQDFTDGGLSVDESVQVGVLLADVGIDAIELSGGLLTSRRMGPSRIRIDSEEKEAYYRKECREFKQKVATPLILVGGIRSFAIAEGLVEEGDADFVSMSRPLIREPDLVNRWKGGNLQKSACDSDNRCFKPTLTGEGIYCVSKKLGK